MLAGLDCQYAPSVLQDLGLGLSVSGGVAYLCSPQQIPESPESCACTRLLGFRTPEAINLKLPPLHESMRLNRKLLAWILHPLAYRA